MVGVDEVGQRGAHRRDHPERHPALRTGPDDFVEDQQEAADSAISMSFSRT